MSAAPPDGQYFDYAAQNQYATNSPDTFYGQVVVQPPTLSHSDSANTPPSQAPTSKSRRSVARPSQSTHSTQSKQYSNVDSYDLNSSRGPSTQVRKERERQLANTPREALIQLTIRREYENKRAKQLLTTAVLQLQAAQENLAREEEARKRLEEDKHVASLKTTQAIINAQTESINVQQEIGTYKLQVENLQRELRHARDTCRAIEAQRDEAERALVRSRTSARQMKEQNVLLLAREEGRREGFEEGLRQGRISLEDGQITPKPRKIKHAPAPPPPPGPTAAQLREVENAAAALRKIDEDEKLRIKKQLAHIEMDLDAERQKFKDAQRTIQHMIEEMKRKDGERERVERERESERRARKEAEREKDAIKRQEEARIKKLEEDKERLKEDKARQLEELRRDKERLEKEKQAEVDMAQKTVDLERERIKRLEEDRDRDHERERLREERDHEREIEKEKETSATIAATAAAAAAAVTAAVGAAKSSGSSYRQGSSVRSSSPMESHPKLPYLPMPAPPMVPGPGMPVPIVMPSASGSGGGVPRAASSGSQRGYGRDRRMSGASYSSMTSGLPLDMLQLPSEMRGGDLRAIPEDASFRGASPMRPMSRAGGGQPPMWGNPMSDFSREGGGGVEDWRSGVGPGNPYGSQAPISMPRAPMDDIAFTPSTVPRGQGDSAGYQTPAPGYQGGPMSMPRAPGEAPASYQPPITMPTAPGEGPSTYKPPLVMPTAPGEGPATYKPPITMPTAPGEGPATYKPPITMPTAPGEQPATYKPPLTMPTAPGEGPSTYKPPIVMPQAPGEEPATYKPPITMPTAPGEAPATYRPPPTTSSAPGEDLAGYRPPLTMPTAPGEEPATYRPPTSMSGPPGGDRSAPPLTMPRAPGDGPEYHPPSVMQPAPGETGYQTPITMPRAPGDNGAAYQPPAGSAHAPRSHTPSISMPRAPGDGPGYVPPPSMSQGPEGGYVSSAGMTMPRAPMDGVGPTYTPRTRSSSITMPRAPGEGPAYVPPVTASQGSGGGYTPRTRASSISMPRAPGEGPAYVPPVATSQGSGRGGYAPSGGVKMPRAPMDDAGSAPRAHTPFPSRAPAEDVGFIPPVIPRPPSSMGQRGFGGGAGDYSSNSNLLSPHTSNRNGLIRRPSNGSNSSYEINVHPPSRPPSSLMDDRDRDHDPYSYLSPNHQPAPLPHSQPVILPHAQPVVLPVLPRSRRGNDTVPNSPINAPFGLPPNFIPQTLTDRNGVSTPIHLPGVLPGGQPVISRPPSAPGGAIYGNPLANMDRDNDSPPALANRSPFIPPTAFGSQSPFIPPGSFGSAGVGASSPNVGGWGVPSRAGSLSGGGGGMTPGSMTRELSGQRTPVSIYGPPAGAGGFSPNVRNSPAVMSMPVPTVRDDEDDDGFDQTTIHNTRLNTIVTVPTPVAAPKKKKKGGKR